MIARTRYGTKRTWLTAGERLSLRIERELGIAIAEHPEKIRPLGWKQKGHGVISWSAKSDDGREIVGEQTIGECLAAKVLTASKPNRWFQIDITGD